MKKNVNYFINILKSRVDKQACFETTFAKKYTCNFHQQFLLHPLHL